MTFKYSTSDWRKVSAAWKGLGGLKLKTYPPSYAASLCLIPAVNSAAARACDDVDGLSFVGTLGGKQNHGVGAKTTKREILLGTSRGTCAPQSDRHLHNNWFTILFVSSARLAGTG